MDTLNFILTCDDVGRDTVENFNKVISLLDECDIKCTFFAVPKPRDAPPLEKNKEWIDTLRGAIKKGHDVQLHGYSHEKFECGTPEGLILELHGKDARKELLRTINENRTEIEKNLEYNKLFKRLSESKVIFEKIFGYSPICFRSPLLGLHKNLYPVLSKLGIKYCSNLIINPRSQSYIIGEREEIGKWDKVNPLPTEVHDGIIELPLTCEYSWFLEENQIDRAFELIKSDAKKISKIKNAFMMPLSHFYAIAKSPASAELYRRFFDWAKKNFDFKSYTIKEYIRKFIENQEG